MTSPYDAPYDPYDDPEGTSQPLGTVAVHGRGALAYALLEGEPLLAYATHALAAAGAQLVDFNVGFDRVREEPRTLVLHDPLCPLTPVWFLRAAIRSAEDDDTVVVGVQPVTDTIKSARDGVVGATVDRDRLWAVTSPVVLPARVVARLEDWPDTDDFTALVGRLRERFDVRFLDSPPLARRVDDESSLAVLRALAAQEGPSATADLA